MSTTEFSMPVPLQGQVAIVTGGASGIGRAAALRLARAGCKVVISDINPERIETAVAEAAALGAEVIGQRCDIRKPEDNDALVAKAVERFGRIDILVHAAGILRDLDSGPRILPQIATNECHVVIDTNLKGTFLIDRAVLQQMTRQRSGQIVNISSTSGLKAMAFDSVYCASKFGVVGLTQSLAEEVRQFGIKVHLLCPGAVDTPLWDRNGHIRAPEHSLSPDRIAYAIEFLLSMPEDMVLETMIVNPFRSRRRKKKPAAETPS